MVRKKFCWRLGSGIRRVKKGSGSQVGWRVLDVQEARKLGVSCGAGRCRGRNGINGGGDGRGSRLHCLAVTQERRRVDSHTNTNTGREGQSPIKSGKLT